MAREAFLRLLPSYDPRRGAPLGGYLWPRLRGAVDHLVVRPAYRYVPVGDLLDKADCAPGADDTLLDKALLLSDINALKHYLSTLPSKERSLLYDVYWDGLSMAEIARRQGVTRSAISQRHARILKRARAMFGRRK